MGRPAAIERFTEELLLSPQPPDNWETIYKLSITIPENIDNSAPPQVAHGDVQQRTLNQGRTLGEGPGQILRGLLQNPGGQLKQQQQQPLPDQQQRGGQGASLPTHLIQQPCSQLGHADCDAGARLSEEAALQNLQEQKTNTNTEEPIASSSTQDPSSSSSPVPSSSKHENELDLITAWETEKNSVLLSIFPDLCPDYLASIVQNVRSALEPAPGEAAPDEAATAPDKPTIVIEEDKPSLSDLDHVFAAKVEELFAMRTEERRLLPTRKEWETKRKAKEELEKWSGNMSVNDMLLLYCGDPAGYFGNPERSPESRLYKQHAIEELKKVFRFHSINEIEKTFKNSKSLYPAYKNLSSGKKTRKTKRAEKEIKFPSEHSIEFLKERKFIELEEDIKREIDKRAEERRRKVEEAQVLGQLQECLCCYSEDCLPEDMISCRSGHVYCRDCITRGTDVAIGEGKTVIQCLGHCNEEIGWQELQKVVAPNVLSKLLQRRQAEEVGAADMDNVVTCPFCPYMTIMDNPDDKVLVCRNAECGRDSCR